MDDETGGENIRTLCIGEDEFMDYEEECDDHN
jgi:hypothetical protein